MGGALPITLRIDNVDRLPDGGPIEFTAGPRGFDIGRAQHLDWTLPDPELVISGHHCRVRYDNGEYWLEDVSRNGTYLNGASGRVKSPYRLQEGDRLQIGPYFIQVSLGGAPARPAAPFESAPVYAPPAPGGDLWSLDVEVPQPADRKWFTAEQRRETSQRAPDVLEHFVELPMPRAPAQAAPESWGPGPEALLRNVPASHIPDRPPLPPSSAAPVSPRPAPITFPDAGGTSADAFIAAFAQAAGLSPEILARRNADELGTELGTILKLVTQRLIALLALRAGAKQMAKSSSRTMIGPERNNPLKFIANHGEALDVMFGRTRPGYLGAGDSFQEAFNDIQQHEIATIGAMQKALARLMEDLLPEAVEEKAGSSPFGSRKARAWDIYVERWRAKTEHYENGLLDLFLTYFAQAYDSASKDK